MVILNKLVVVVVATKRITSENNEIIVTCYFLGD